MCFLLPYSTMPPGWSNLFIKVLITTIFVEILGDLIIKPCVAIAVLSFSKRTVLSLPEGLQPFYTWGFRKWFFSNMLFYCFADWLDDYYGTEIMCVFFRLCGAKVGQGVKLFSAGGPAGQGHVRNEMEQLVIEDNVVLDLESLIQGHTIENGGMTFKLTTLGANSIISSRSNILPGAQVGRQCNLLEGTLIPPHADVAENSIVSGCPFQVLVCRDESKAAITGKP